MSPRTVCPSGRFLTHTTAGKELTQANAQAQYSLQVVLITIRKTLKLTVQWQPDAHGLIDKQLSNAISTLASASISGCSMMTLQSTGSAVSIITSATDAVRWYLLAKLDSSAMADSMRAKAA